MISKPFIKLNSVDSTNNYAMQQLKNDITVSGTAYFAFEQTQGKGQRSKIWQSEKGSNITLSVVLDATAFQTVQPALFSYAVANALYNFFNNYVFHYVSIKWPNDLYWRDRKAGGILIENIWQKEKWLYAIVGMGININQTKFESGLQAVSLKQITGKNYDVITLAKELCVLLEQETETLKINSTKSFNNYNSHLYKLNKTAIFKSKDKQFTALIKGVDEEGKLLLFTDKLFSVSHGEVEWLIR